MKTLSSGGLRAKGEGSPVLAGICLLLLAACAAPTPAASVSAPASTPTQPDMPCTILPFAGEVSETMNAFIDPFAHVTGPEAAPVTLLVFTEFQCLGCALLADAIHQVLEAHPEQVRLIVRYLPDARQDKSALAIQAAEAAHLQGKFWEMYELLFERQPDWSGLPAEEFPAWVGDQAPGLGLDAERFAADLASDQVAGRVRQILESTGSLADRPPLLFINSTTRHTGLADFSSLDQMVRLSLLESVKFHACPPWVIDPRQQYLVTLETGGGEVVIQLYPEKTPMAVNNFVFLAQQGWYDWTPFHRVSAGIVIQAGDPSGTGLGNPGYYFTTEAAAGLSFDRPGMVAMSNTGVDTNGSQFFITFAPLPDLNNQFTIFGEVLIGLDILAGLQAGDLLAGVDVQER